MGVSYTNLYYKKIYYWLDKYPLINIFMGLYEDIETSDKFPDVTYFYVTHIMRKAREKARKEGILTHKETLQERQLSITQIRKIFNEIYVQLIKAADNIAARIITP